MKHRKPSNSSISRRGLTFIELLFSVVILGIGMIIIASVFPVAIAEQRASLDAVTANMLERTAARTIDGNLSPTLPTSPASWLPDTTAGTVVALSDNSAVWDRVKGDLISKADTHYAWSGLYQRVPYTDTVVKHNWVTLFVVTLASREDAQFDPTNKNTFDKLKPLAVKFTYDSSVSPNTVKITQSEMAKPFFPCEGGYIIRSSDVKGPLDPPQNIPFPQNAIIKLGNERPDLEMPGTYAYEVAPGFEYIGDAAAITGTQPAYMFGRDPTRTDGTGANQVISCRAVFIDVQDPS